MINCYGQTVNPLPFPWPAELAYSSVTEFAIIQTEHLTHMLYKLACSGDASLKYCMVIELALTKLKGHNNHL